MKNITDYEIELDYLILSCIVNSDETETDIVNMVYRYFRFLNDSRYLHIQNPPSETK